MYWDLDPSIPHQVNGMLTQVVIHFLTTLKWASKWRLAYVNDRSDFKYLYFLRNDVSIQNSSF